MVKPTCTCCRRLVECLYYSTKQGIILRNSMSPCYLSTQFTSGEIEERNSTYRWSWFDHDQLQNNNTVGWTVASWYKKQHKENIFWTIKLTMCTGMLLNQFISFIVPQVFLGKTSSKTTRSYEINTRLLKSSWEIGVAGKRKSWSSCVLPATR